MNTDDSPPAPPPSRWRFQYNLRLLFLITALWACILGWWSMRRDIEELHVAQSCAALYLDNGTLEIIVKDPQVTLTEKTIADSIALVDRSHPITSMTIGRWEPDRGNFFPVKLTSAAWNLIRQQNLKCLSIALWDDGSIRQLEGLSTLEDLTLFGTITPTEDKRLRQALPHCRIDVRGGRY
jgi:hypothetical protein